MDDADVEQLIHDPDFRRILPARPPSIYSDPSGLDLHSLGKWLFGRPVSQRDSDRPFLDGSGFVEIADLNRFIVTVRQLFLNFGEIASRFSPRQVDQGLWYLFCEPLWLLHRVMSGGVPSSQVMELTHAMYCPFRDYYGPMGERYSGSAFFMWWDNFSSGGQHPELDTAAIEVLRQTLALPHKECREAALHGLNHLFPDPRATAAIDQYLDGNRASLSKEQIKWAELCRAGEAR